MPDRKGQPVHKFELDYGVPVEDSMWPHWVTIATLCIDGMPQTLEPSAGEVRQIRSYIDYKLDTFYQPSVRARCDEVYAGIPIVSGHNTVVLLKRLDGWGYRRSTWRTGTWPHFYRGMRATNVPTEPLTLLAVLDHVESVGGAYPGKPWPRWEAWKQQHGLEPIWLAEAYATLRDVVEEDVGRSTDDRLDRALRDIERAEGGS